LEINKVFLSLGSNIGDRVHNLSLARTVISDKIGNITINSKIYQSEPWGFELQDSFLNQIIIVETYLNSKEVLTKILNIEKKLGRVRKRKWGPRNIDIDILFYNDEVIYAKNLIIPHPLIQKRNFILIPLNEIAKNYIHPKINKTINQLLKSSKDKLNVFEHGISI
tara:strand:- start:27 stop:524 length:498 start_codon:yes stop_codon:yes gene_type:complete